MLEIGPFPLEGVSVETVALEVADHVRGKRAPGAGEQHTTADDGFLDGNISSTVRVFCPVLHDHGDAGGAATIPDLCGKRHIQPDISWYGCRTLDKGEQQAEFT